MTPLDKFPPGLSVPWFAYSPPDGYVPVPVNDEIREFDETVGSVMAQPTIWSGSGRIAFDRPAEPGDTERFVVDEDGYRFTLPPATKVRWSLVQDPASFKPDRNWWRRLLAKALNR